MSIYGMYVVFVSDNLTSAAWFIAVICAVAVAVIAILACCIHQRSKGGKYPGKPLKHHWAIL